MAILHPFRALRPNPAHVADVICPPYDVINTAEARALAEGKKDSFLHVIRPEIGFPLGTDEHADEVYEAGARNLTALRESDSWIQDGEPSLYVYKLRMGERTQTGVFGCVAVSDYDNDVILKHEKTRVDKEDDRTRHIVTMKAHAEPVMLTYRDSASINALVAATMETSPVYDVEGPGGVQHTVWSVTDAEALVGAFADVPKLYVADGHHRCKAASRTASKLGGQGEVGFFPAVLFPMGEMDIMAYNRVILEANEPISDLILEMGEVFGTTRVETGTPDRPGEVRFYAKRGNEGAWFSLDLPKTRREGVANELDVARLSEFVLERMFGIENPRTDTRIKFVGGIRGTEELVRLVEGGDALIAFSMYPTSIEELIDVSDAGLLMPPKSTWFEPKLASGLLVHLFG